MSSYGLLVLGCAGLGLACLGLGLLLARMKDKP